MKCDKSTVCDKGARWTNEVDTGYRVGDVSQSTRVPDSVGLSTVCKAAAGRQPRLSTHKSKDAADSESESTSGEEVLIDEGKFDNVVDKGMGK